jgi:hypothetical protein
MDYVSKFDFELRMNQVGCQANLFIACTIDPLYVIVFFGQFCRSFDLCVSFSLIQMYLSLRIRLNLFIVAKSHLSP